jgi:hypothetical protein
MDFNVDEVTREELVEIQMDELYREYEEKLWQACQIIIVPWGMIIHE